MIDDARFAEIRRLFFAEHLPLGTIATQVGVHVDVVRRAIGTSAFNQRKPATVRRSHLDPYRAFIAEMLERYPRLRATRLYDMIRARGYPGSVGVVRRHVQGARRAPRAEAFLRRTTLPGEEAQVDWAQFGRITVGAAERPLSCFVMVLGHSRALHARFYLDQRTTSFLDGHVRAFAAFGGVPRRILYDNLKSAVVERVGDAIHFGDDLLHLAAHYHFEPRPCAPYRGNEKGKVERAIQYLRHRFFEARSFRDLADLNAQLEHWIVAVAHARIAPGDAARRTVAELLAGEQPRLLPLPAAEWPVEEQLQIASGKSPLLRVDLNDYSIPHRLVGQPLGVRVSTERVRIFDPAGALVVVHTRSFGRGEGIEDPAHTAALRTDKRHARELRGRDEIIRLCPSAPALLAALVERGVPLQRECRSLLLLCERYGAAAVDAAIAACLARGLSRAQDIERHIDTSRARDGLAPRADSVGAALTRPVPAASLSTYDALARRKEKP